MSHPRRVSPPALLLLPLLAGMLAAWGCGARPQLDRPPAGAPPANLLLITLDTVRADALGCYGNSAARTPHLDALAKNGALFRNAYTPVPITLAAHASILTGAGPEVHGVHNNGDYGFRPDVRTLAEALREKGYHTGAVIGAFPLLARFHLDRGFEHYDDAFPEQTTRAGKRVPGNERRAGAVVDAAIAWLDTLPKGKPWFLWVHFFDAHAPYDPPAPFAGGGTDRARYAGEIAYTDSELGRLIDHLQGMGAWQRTLVVAAGDHGEDLGDHGELTHSFFLYDSTLHVPLLIARAGARAREVTEPVSLIDIFPTVADLLAADAGDHVRGVSLVDLLAGRSRKLDRSGLYAETLYPSIEFGFAPLHALRSGGWKLILAPKQELYHVAKDPGETENRISERPDVAAALRKRLLEHLDASRRAATKPAAQAEDAATRERLASLGYTRVGGIAPGDEKAPDPKDVLPLYLELRAASRMALNGRPKEGIHGLEALEGKFSGSLSFHLELGGLYWTVQDLPKAKVQFEKALAIDPRQVNAHLNLAAIAYKERRFADAVREYEAALAVDPSQWMAIDHLTECLLERCKKLSDGGDTHGALGALEEARRRLEDAMRIDDIPPDRRKVLEDRLNGVRRVSAQLEKRSSPPESKQVEKEP